MKKKLFEVEKNSIRGRWLKKKKERRLVTLTAFSPSKRIHFSVLANKKRENKNSMEAILISIKRLSKKNNEAAWTINVILGVRCWILRELGWLSSLFFCVHYKLKTLFKKKKNNKKNKVLYSPFGVITPISTPECFLRIIFQKSQSDREHRQLNHRGGNTYKTKFLNLIGAFYLGFGLEKKLQQKIYIKKCRA